MGCQESSEVSHVQDKSSTNCTIAPACLQNFPVVNHRFQDPLLQSDIKYLKYI